MSDNTIDGLKQRLVGAFVILSLAIIFLPMIFDKPHSVGTSSIATIPPEPDVKPVIIKKPEKPAYKKIDIDPSDNKVKEVDKIPSKPVAVTKAGDSAPDKVAAKQSTATQTKKATASKPVSTAKVEPKKVAKVVPAKESSPKVSHLPVFKNVWMVQLGTFSNHENAFKLRDRLRKDGFDGHTKDIVIDGKKAVRVFTGPFVNKQTAQKNKKKVDRKYKVKSLILYFDA